MSSRGVCDTRCQAFLTAMIQKEESTRIRWFLKNQEKLLSRLGKEVTTPPTRELDKKESVDIV